MTIVSSVIKKTVVNSALALGACALSLLIGELAVRFVWTDWKEAFDQRADFEYEPAKEAQELGSFREGVPGDKKPGVFRIIVLGDSISWGDKIRRDQDVWPQVLEGMLSRQFPPGASVEVINLARSGFTTANEKELLERFGWGLDPDLILVQFCLNDALPSGSDFSRVGEEWIYRRKNLISRDTLNASLERRSYLYSFLNDRFKRWQKIRSGRDYHYLYREDFTGWQDCKSALQAIATGSKNHNIPVFLMIFPSFEEGLSARSTYKYTAIHDKVSGVAKSCGFYVLDLLEEFIAQGKDFRSWHAMALDAHPNEYAHRVTAEAVFEALRRLDLVPLAG